MTTPTTKKHGSGAAFYVKWVYYKLKRALKRGFKKIPYGLGGQP